MIASDAGIQKELADKAAHKAEQAMYAAMAAAEEAAAAQKAAADAAAEQVAAAAKAAAAEKDASEVSRKSTNGSPLFIFSPPH